MKLLLVSAVIFVVTLGHPLEYDLERDLQLAEWENFKMKHMKTYKSLEEEAERKFIFLENLKFINEHNKKYNNGEVSYYVAVNKYADMTAKEFTSKMNRYRRPSVRSGTPFNSTGSKVRATSVDWRNEGAVTSVKDQGLCGGGYAFSATGALEGQTFIKKNKLVSLSEQNLLDCSQETGNSGCYGGTMDASFNYIISNYGIDTEDSYAFEGDDIDCRYNVSNRGAIATGYTDLPFEDESSLEEAVADVGPISVGIDASLTSFRYYSGGVFKNSDCSSTELDHAVLVVGYSQSWLRGKYWIVKNSWGSDWGEQGYIRIARDKENMCGIATVASYPTLLLLE